MENMRITTMINKIYTDIYSIKGDLEYDEKIKELMDILREVSKIEKRLKASSLKKYLIEIQKLGSLINNINLSNQEAKDKDIYLEQCRLMIEVYLGQVLILELECEKLSGH